MEETEWPDLMKIPANPKLLKTDYKTLINAKRLINDARENKKLESILHGESDALNQVYIDEEFPEKMARYVISLA